MYAAYGNGGRQNWLFRVNGNPQRKIMYTGKTVRMVIEAIVVKIVEITMTLFSIHISPL
jgi:hypothetical protein